MIKYFLVFFVVLITNVGFGQDIGCFSKGKRTFLSDNWSGDTSDGNKIPLDYLVWVKKKSKNVLIFEIKVYDQYNDRYEKRYYLLTRKKITDTNFPNNSVFLSQDNEVKAYLYCKPEKEMYLQWKEGSMGLYKEIKADF